MSKRTQAPRVPMSRVIVNTRDAGTDKWIPTATAQRLYDEGKLAVDLTNTKSVRVYCPTDTTKELPCSTKVT